MSPTDSKKTYKIAVIKPGNTGVYKDDTTMFIEGLREQGHTVVEVPLMMHNGELAAYEDFDKSTIKGADLYWAPYEPLIPVALKLKEYYHAPVVGHFEVIPPWRVNLDSIYNSAYINIAFTDEEKKRHEEYYSYATAWLQCDVKTTIDQFTKYNIERLLGQRVDSPVSIKPYPLDTKLLDTYRKEQEPKFQICTVCRLVPHKRIHHVIRALSYIPLEKRPHYVVVGKGPEKDTLIEYAKSLGVSVEFKELVSDEVKCNVIQESLFAVQLWSWLPVGEAAYLKRASIVYDHPDTMNRVGYLTLSTRCNDVKALAESIYFLSENRQQTRQYGELSYNSFFQYRVPFYPIEKATEELVKIFDEAFV